MEALAAVAKPVVGQEYELDYQFTTHTRKGVDGKLVDVAMYNTAKRLLDHMGSIRALEALISSHTRQR